MKKLVITNVFVLFTIFGYSQIGVGINTTSPNSNFEVNGSQGQKVTTITANTTLDATHNVVICNNGAVAITVTLPAVAGCTGRIYTIKRESTSTATVTIDANAAETIDGNANFVIGSSNESISIISSGAEWKRLASSGSVDGIVFPMGEMSYYDFNGFTIPTSGTFSTVNFGAANPHNMLLCNPTYAGPVNMDINGNSLFTMTTNGYLKYIGSTERMFHIACTFSVQQASGTNHHFVFAVAQNGDIIESSRVVQKISSTGDSQSTAIHVCVSLMPNDDLSLWVGDLSGSGTTIKIQTINLFALGMGM